MFTEEPLYSVVTNDQTYFFATADDFYDFMAEHSDHLTINRIEKYEN
ncbi:hypothetical protein [Paenibacillus cremeus]|nr:hypothetical protein [Paenibacillus cremeus]